MRRVWARAPTGAACAGRRGHEAAPQREGRAPGGRRAPPRVGAGPNGVGSWQRDKLDHAGIADLVDATVVSYEAGAHKPDPAPFERAESALPADRRVMIGDSEEADVGGARDRGWEAVHVAGPDDVPDAIDAIR
mgnify:CR=1 FL=1